MGERYSIARLQDEPYFDNARKWASPLNYGVGFGQPIKKDIYIHDVTLRDGEQSPGVCFRENDRVKIGIALSELGVKRIEAGMPIVSEEIARAIKRLVDLKLQAEVVAFARAHADDIEAALRCGVRAVVVEHTVNPYLCKYAYGLDEDQVIERVINAVQRAKKEGLHTTFMGWDFFRSPLEFTEKIYRTVVTEAHPDAITLVDTFGVATPLTVYGVFTRFRKLFPDLPLEFHVHNEFGMATGAALAAISGGADGIHSAINGLGERTGNVATEEVVMALDILFGVRTGVNTEKLGATCRLVSELSGVPIPGNKPVTGARVFQVESGVVTDVYRKVRAQGIRPAMTPYMPEAAGVQPISFVLGKGSGTASIEYFLEKHGLTGNPMQVARILERVKAKAYENKGLVPDDQFLEIARDVLGAG